MPVPLLALDVDDLVKRYRAGQGIEEIGRSVGCGRSTVSKRLRDAGIRMRSGESRTGKEVAQVDVAGIGRRYVAGESEKAIAQSLDVARSVVRRRLVAAGIEIRGRSEAMHVRMGNATAEQRRALTAAAHDACRGSKRSLASLAEAAAKREGRITANVSPVELGLAAALRACGLDVIHQKAVGPYSVDLASGSIAVEILGGGWHRSKKHGERLRYILDARWDVIYVWVGSSRSGGQPLGGGAADYVVAHSEFRDRNPAAARCYRVIRGGGQFVAGGSADGDDVPDVIPVSYCADVASPEIA